MLFMPLPKDEIEEKVEQMTDEEKDATFKELFEETSVRFLNVF